MEFGLSEEQRLFDEAVRGFLADRVPMEERRRLAAGTDPQTVLEYLAGSLLKKLLHKPTVRLREAGETSDQALIEVAQELFGLGDEDDRSA